MNIILADDDAIVSMSLKTILEASGEISVAAIGKNGRDAVELYFEHRPDVALLDIQMPEMSGLAAAEIILNREPTAKILFLTTFSDDDYIVKALRIGAKGYILKQDYEGIAPALRVVMSGQSVFGREVVSKLPLLLQSEAFKYSDRDITEKEEEVIILVAEGLSNKEIAEKLYLSVGTVRNYLSVILDKLELRNRTELAIFHYKNH